MRGKESGKFFHISGRWLGAFFCGHFEVVCAWYKIERYGYEAVCWDSNLLLYMENKWID
jgi:hypothetical protein